MSAIIHIVGRLGNDPETRTVGDQVVCGFSVAVDRKAKGESVTTWFRCQVWGRQAQTAQQYLAKGRQVAVHGRFELREFTTNDGTVKTSQEVSVIGFDLIGVRNDEAEAPAARPAARPAGGGFRQGMSQPNSRQAVLQKHAADELDDEIPFIFLSEEIIQRRLSDIAGLSPSIV